MPDADVIDRPAAGEALPEKVAKSKFAEMCGVTPGRVSQWIAEGKISRDALDGEGRAAKVIVARAVRDLTEKLDLSQSIGLNGLASRLSISGLANRSPSAADARPAPPVALPSGDDGADADLFEASGDDATDETGQDRAARTDGTTDAIARERLTQQQLRTRRMEREEALESGRYVLAEDARAQIGRTASTVLTAVEAGFNTVADDLVARFPDMPRRDVLHVLTTSFRKVRERAAHGFAEKRDAAEAEAGNGEGE